MAVHLRRAFEQASNASQPSASAALKPDRRPQRIAPADAFAELAGSRVSSTPHSIALSGFAVSAIDPAVGIGDAGSSQPRQRASRLSSVSVVVKVFDATTTRVVAGSSGSPLLERGAVDVRDDRTSERRARGRARRPAAPGPAPSRRCRCGGCGQVAERARLDRVDQRPHALAAGGREIDLVAERPAALGDMRRRRGPRSG